MKKLLNLLLLTILLFIANTSLAQVPANATKVNSIAGKDWWGTNGVNFSPTYTGMFIIHDSTRILGLADSSVCFIGAGGLLKTDSVNLKYIDATNTLITSNIKGDTFRFENNFIVQESASDIYIWDNDKTGSIGFDPQNGHIDVTAPGSSLGNLIITELTATRNYMFPDKTGTITLQDSSLLPDSTVLFVGTSGLLSTDSVNFVYNADSNTLSVDTVDVGGVKFSDGSSIITNKYPKPYSTFNPMIFVGSNFRPTTDSDFVNYLIQYKMMVLGGNSVPTSTRHTLELINDSATDGGSVGSGLGISGYGAGYSNIHFHTAGGIKGASTAGNPSTPWSCGWKYWAVTGFTGSIAAWHVTPRETITNSAGGISMTFSMAALGTHTRTNVFNMTADSSAIYTKLYIKHSNISTSAGDSSMYRKASGEIVSLPMGKLLGNSDVDSALYEGNIRTTTATTVNITGGDYMLLVDATAGNVTINLPAVTGTFKREITVKKIDASGNTVTIEGDGAETIDGAANLVISTQNVSHTVKSDNVAWWVK